MKNRLKLMSLAIGSAVVVSALVVGAHASSQNTSGSPAAFRDQGPGGPPPWGPGEWGRGGLSMLGPLGIMGSRLGLSDSQKDQIKTAVQAHADQMKPLADRAAAAHR